MYKNGLLRNDVLVWRLIGAAVWVVAGLGVAAYVWELSASPSLLLSPWSAVLGVFSPLAWWRIIKLSLAQSIAFAAHSAVVTTAEPLPAYGLRVLGGSTSAAALMVSKVLGRAGSAAGLLACVAYPAAHAVSALLFFLLDVRARGTLSGGQGGCGRGESGWGRWDGQRERAKGCGQLNWRRFTAWHAAV